MEGATVADAPRDGDGDGVARSPAGAAGAPSDGPAATTGATVKENIFFVERVEFLAILATVVATDDAAVAHASVDRLARILENYQEQPHLLDSHLERIVVPTMLRVRARVREWDDSQRAEADAAAQRAPTTAPSLWAPARYRDPVLHALLRLIYALAKTRGHKTIMKFFPHEVADLEPALHALVCQVGPRGVQRVADTHPRSTDGTGDRSGVTLPRQAWSEAAPVHTVAAGLPPRTRPCGSLHTLDPHRVPLVAGPSRPRVVGGAVFAAAMAGNPRHGAFRPRHHRQQQRHRRRVGGVHSHQRRWWRAVRGGPTVHPGPRRVQA